MSDDILENMPWRYLLRGMFAISLALALAAQIAAQNPPAPQPPAANEAKPQPPAAPPKPDPVKPYADLIKGATEIPGLFNLYRTEDKVWMEIKPDQFDKLYMLSVTCDSGLGERGFYAAALCGHTPIRMRKVNQNVQVILRNASFRADEGTPMERTVGRSFSDSVLGITAIASQPHPERKSVLIDLANLLIADVPMLGWGLERSFRIPYRFDAKNSFFGKLKGFERNVEIETIAHYAAERPPLPPVAAPGAPPPPQVDPPRAIPDVRSMLFSLRYSLAELPEAGYRPRLADDRIGHFATQLQDYSENRDHVYTPNVRYINRWRLEKADPNAAISRPKKPIVFWLDNNIPLRYRETVREGVLMWNSAFEKIGFKDAVEARQQPDDADWDPADSRYNTIRWFVGVDAGFAQGPSRANPFTGELYDADIRMADIFSRARRQALVMESNPISHLTEERALPFSAPWSAAEPDFCTLESDAIADAAFASDVLEAREIEPDSPEADKMVQAYIREIIAHEVGHTLGLRHNFRASTIHTLAASQNSEVTAKVGLTASVMDYIPANLAAKGAKQGEYHQSTLGPYDYWAIEYAYKPIEASTPEGELPELMKIAARAAEPMLAYATDDDAGFGPVPFNIDPTVNRFDLGSDPLQYYAHRIHLSQEIWAGIEAKLGRQGDGYQVMRRSFMRALQQDGQAMFLSATYVGGIYHYREHIGDPNGRLPFVPVPAAKQKEALHLINENGFARGAFQFSPALLNKLDGERQFDRFSPLTTFNQPKDVPLHDAVLAIQKGLLDRVFHPVLLKRLVDSELRYSDVSERFRIGDLFTSVYRSIWSEAIATGPVDINSLRRALQREHLRKMMDMVLRNGAVPEDARTLARFSLTQLKPKVQVALTRAANTETRAHLEETLARIDETLAARMQRTAY